MKPMNEEDCLEGCFYEHFNNKCRVKLVEKRWFNCWLLEHEGFTGYHPMDKEVFLLLYRPLTLDRTYTHAYSWTFVHYDLY